MKRWKLPIILGLGLILMAGFLRLRIDVDVFNLLPADSPVVDGLKLYQRSFGASQDLIISLRSPDANLTEPAVRALAEKLEDSGLTSRVIWRSPLGDNPDQLGEFLAYLWFNQPEKNLESLLRKLQEGQMEITLAKTVERLTTSLRPQEVARLAHDPFAITDLPASVTSPLTQWVGDPFASRDGGFRILFVQPPFEKAGIWKSRQWVASLTDLCEEFKREHALGDSLTLGLTGNPVFMAETGSGLMRDLLLAALGTLVFVAGLFWLAHRNWIPLLWLVTLLVVVLMTTVALGSMILGTLNAVSLGFAAILMGLAADYALILYQEFMVHSERSLAEHRSVVAPGILWAAVTTAGAFLMIGRSSLPGLTQLGTLVGIGILVAAGVMLLAFLPPLAGRVRLRQKMGPGRKSWISNAGVLQPRALWGITLLAAVLSMAVLIVRLPTVDYGTKNLGPREGKALAALEEVQREIGGYDDALWLIISGDDEREVSESLEASGKMLDEGVKEGLLSGYTLPNAVWPRPDNQQGNREIARRIASRLPAAREAALEMGFTEESLKLTGEVFAALERFAATDGVVWPTSAGSQWVLRQFVGSDSGRKLTLGRLEASSTTTQGDLLKLSERLLSVTGAQMIGWSLLSESLMEIMQRDVRRVLIPMGAVLLLLLGLAFRKISGIALSLITLGFSFLCLLGLMALMGWSWNLMNVMALPLLFGAGVDYSIHIQFALQRNNGDRSRVYQVVGRAILLCGVSTAAGFGSLGFATNAGLASLGRVCSAGIVITCLVSVFLLPVWWLTMGKCFQGKHEEEVS